jgi:hypothetical protein
MSEGGKTGAWRAVGPLVALVVLVVCVLCGRMLLGARAELQRAELAVAADDARGARTHLRRALAYYLPGNPWHERAAATLARLAQAAEAKGQPMEALEHWRALRGAILRLRGLTRPLSAYLPRANRRIAALSARHPEAATALRQSSGQARHLRRLEQPEEPDPAWTATSLVGFVLFLGAAFALMLTGLDRRMRPQRARFWPLLLLTVVALGLLCVGLASANPRAG